MLRRVFVSVRFDSRREVGMFVFNFHLVDKVRAYHACLLRNVVDGEDADAAIEADVLLLVRDYSIVRREYLVSVRPKRLVAKAP